MLKNLIGLTTWVLTVFALALSPSMAVAEDLAVIVHPNNPIGKLDRGTIASMYRGEQLHWADGGRIKLVNREISSLSRKQFYREVLNAKPDQTFYRPGTPVAVQSLIQRSDEAVTRFVASIEGAIGYVNLSEVTDEVTVILIIPDR